MFEECAPPIPVAIILGCSVFVNSVGSIEAAASDAIQEITFLGSCLMYDDAAVCGGRTRLKTFVSVSSNIWKYRERESAIIFSVPSMCCEYRNVSLTNSVHLSQQDTVVCYYAFTGLKDTLCIQPSALELSVNAKMCDPCPICWMVM